MNKKEEKKLRDFVGYIFKQNPKIITLNITAVSKKKKGKYTKDTIGNKVNGFTFRRQDFAVYTEGVKDGE